MLFKKKNKDEVSHNNKQRWIVKVDCEYHVRFE
jgi:hypothetical protein